MTKAVKGHWVVDIINGRSWYSCSECLHVISNYEGCFHYCPVCGSELKGEKMSCKETKITKEEAKKLLNYEVKRKKI